MIEPAPDTSDIERVRRAVGIVGFVVAGFSLIAGLFFHLAGLPGASALVLQFAFGVLLLMPAKNVAAVLADGLRGRDWWFVLTAVAVIAELSWSVWDRLPR